MYDNMYARNCKRVEICERFYEIIINEYVFLSFLFLLCKADSVIFSSHARNFILMHFTEKNIVFLGDGPSSQNTPNKKPDPEPIRYVIDQNFRKNSNYFDILPLIMSIKLQILTGLWDPKIKLGISEFLNLILLSVSLSSLSLPYMFFIYDF